MNAPDREMTLDEVIGRLPETHSARREYAALRAAANAQPCCVCGQSVDTRENGTPGAQLTDGRWTCSDGCWERAAAAVYPSAADGGVRTDAETLRLHLGELTAEEVRVARAAILYALAQQPGGRAYGNVPAVDAFIDAMDKVYEYRPALSSTGVLLNGRDADRFEGWQLAQAVATTPAAPEGMVLVPVEPTEAMLDAAMQREDDEPLTDWGKTVSAPHAEIWKAMLAAAGEASA